MSDPATVARYGTPLTPREREVLCALWDAGLRSEVAAARLGITVQTVYAHTKNARSRLGVVTTAEAIRAADAYLTLGVAANVA